MTDMLANHMMFAEASGWWDEEYKQVVLNRMLMLYKKEVVMNYIITDMIPGPEGKFLVKWTKRHRPMTEEEYAEKWDIHNQRPQE